MSLLPRNRLERESTLKAHGFTVVADSALRTAEEELRLWLYSKSTLPFEERGC